MAAEPTNPTHQTVLVTGATGGVGRFVVSEVGKAGYRVVAFSRSASAVFGSPTDDVVAVDGSVSDPALVTSVLRDHGVTHVIHVAADLSSGRNTTPQTWRSSGADPWAVPRAVEVNALGTANLCAAATEAGISRLVLMSSKGVYGDLPRTLPGATAFPAEDDLPLQPVSAYGLTKLMAEQACLHFSHQYGLDAVIVRASTTVGPATDTRVRRGATNAILAGVLSGQQVEVAEGGDAIDDFIYLEDLARGLVQVLFAPALQREIYHMSSGVPSTLQTLADAARSIAPDSPLPRIGPGDDFLHLGHNNHAVLSSDAIAAELGFRARTPDQWISSFARDQGIAVAGAH